jgi:SAM-dependent methyltransferase
MSRRREWFRDFFDASYVAQLREEKPPAQSRREVDFVLKALALARGARILDVPCGYGRHASALARRGFRVVGVDLSRAMIAEARRRFAEGPRLVFLQRDMRRLRFRAEFDAVVNLYTSFGYFTPAENRAALRRLARALRPGGRLLIDHRDPEYDAMLPSRPGRPTVRPPHRHEREHAARRGAGPARGAPPPLPLAGIHAGPVARHAPSRRAHVRARLRRLRRAGLPSRRDRASHRGRPAAAASS